MVGLVEALTVGAIQASLPSPLLFPAESHSEGMATWSAPGRNPGSPQERCWPSGLSGLRDAVRPVYSGMLTATGSWPWCETVSAVSSSSHGDF